MASEFGKYVFYKDVVPAFLDSDRSSSGFTNTSRLETLLKDWGFSTVNVTEVTMWKISSKNQYVEDGPRLEWKGKLYVGGVDQLQVIKWKNKNKTKYNKNVKNSIFIPWKSWVPTIQWAGKIAKLFGHKVLILCSYNPFITHRIFHYNFCFLNSEQCSG